MTSISEGPKIAALSCGKPVYLVVLLHGEGADGETVIAEALNWAPTMPKADFVAAQAPLAAPGGGRQWIEAGDLTGAEASRGLAERALELNTLLDEMLAARRLPDSHLALVGFSQGGALALAAALSRPKPMAAVVCAGAALPPDLPVVAAPQVLMIHGEDDAVVPFDAMTATKERLKAAGVPVKSMRRRGVGHVFDDDGVIAAGDFLTALVVHKPAAGAEDADHDHDHDDHDHH